MKKIILFFAIAIFATLLSHAQIKVNSSGKVGIGSVTDPTSALEMADQKWMMFNAHDSRSGILFHETQGKTESTIQYGGHISYDEDNDHFVFGSYQNWVAKDAIWINRGYGNVGVCGIASSYFKLYVHGDAWTDGLWQSSDARFKEDIKNLSTEPNQVIQLRGVSYIKERPTGDYDKDITANSDTIPELTVPEAPEREYGFIAQEVKEIFPDLVMENDEGYLAVNYTGFIPLLVEVFKEQQAQITTLQQIVTEHEQEIIALKEQFASENTLKNAAIDEGNPLETDEIALYQNAPNPFTQETEIKFFIPQEITSAKIYIHDLNGGEIKVYELNERGISSLSIQAAVLNKGMYTYTLVADGAIVDTKRMILTD